MPITLTTTLAGGATGDIEFGALTRVGAGGTPIAEADGIYGEFTVSGGEITPNTTPLTVGTTAVGSTTVAVVADTYSFKPSETTVTNELRTILNLGVATLSGKTIKGRGGNQVWENAAWNNKVYTSLVTITSHDNNNRLRFVNDPLVGNHQYRQATKTKFRQVDFLWSHYPGVSIPTGAAIGWASGPIADIYIEDCDMDGGFTQAEATYGPALFADQYGYKGIFSGTGGSIVLSEGSVFEVRDCQLHGFSRAMNLLSGPGIATIERNEFYDNSTDCLYSTGPWQNGRIIRFNRMHSTNNIVPPEHEVLSVDTVNNRITVASDAYSAKATWTLNISTSTTTPPSGLNYPGVGGPNDYPVTVISATGGQSVLEFTTVDITDAGTNVFVNVEPSHADLVQGAVGSTASGPSYGLEFIGNVGFDKSANQEAGSQVFFFEDSASSGIEGYYDRSVFAGNMGWSSVPQGVFVYPASRSAISDNVMVAPAGLSSGREPAVAALTTWDFAPFNNILANNIARATSSQGVADIVDNSKAILPSAYASSGYFAGTGGYTPTTIDEFITAYARTELNGVIDYEAHTYDLPAANAVDAFTVADQTGVAVSTLITSAAVQITGILNSEGNASAYGAQVSVHGAGSPQFRITSDAGGSTVVTDWNNSYANIEEGEYLWVRHTSAAAGATQTDVFVRVGKNYDIWSTTTA